MDLSFLQHCPRFTKAEEAELARRAHEGDQQARELLVLSVMPYAVKVAKHYLPLPHGIDFDELVQLAAVGVMRAVDKFDPGRARLTTYSTWWIKNEIRRALAENHGGVIHVPTAAAETRGVTAEHLARIRQPLRIGPREAWQIEQEWLAEKELPAAWGIDERDLAARALEVLAELDPRWHEVIVRRCRGETLREISRQLSVTRERVRQIEKRAQEELREIVAGLKRAA